MAEQMPLCRAVCYNAHNTPELGVMLPRSDDLMAIGAIGATATPSYAAADKAMADKTKAAALLASDKQCKACESTIKKDQKAVDEATALAHAEQTKIEAAARVKSDSEAAAARGGINLLV